jgi:hypothetical protein
MEWTIPILVEQHAVRRLLPLDGRPGDCYGILRPEGFPVLPAWSVWAWVAVATADVAEVILAMLPWPYLTDSSTLGLLAGAAAAMVHLWWRWR